MTAKVKKNIVAMAAAFVCLLILPGVTANATAVVTETEPNEFKGMATEFNLGDICYGEMGSYSLYLQRNRTSDIDWYAVNVPNGGTYRFSFFQYFSYFNSTTTMIEICDNSGKKLAAPAYYMKKNGEEYYDFGVVNPGTIYVKFYNYTDFRTKNSHRYAFSIDSVCNVIGHSPETVPGYDATCTEEGLTDGSKCSNCGEILEAQEIIPALGHGSAVVRNKRAATYKIGGYTGDTYCSVCNQLLKEGKNTPKLKAKTQTIKVSTKASKTVKYKAKSLKKRSASFNISARAQGTIRYKLTKGSSKYITVSDSGRVTLKKACKKGTYKITVTASPSYDGKYKKASKTITVKVQ